MAATSIEHNQRDEQSSADQGTLDEKTLQMIEIFAERRFQSFQANQRIRFHLTIWIIRTKIIQNLKRALDILIASGAIVASSPIMGITAVAIKLNSPGPVIFRQTRVGKWGSTFQCYKFRSMYTDAEQRLKGLMAHNEADGPVFKMKHDPRITRVGRIIRKLSIDELPQLFNVLKGEMSLVGPRPALPHEVATYSFDERQRLNAIPGITGLQQVSGRSDIDFKRWVELDVQYISEQSLWKDIEILFKTIPAVLFSKGAY